MKIWLELKKRFAPLSFAKKDARKEEDNFEHYWKEYLHSLQKKSLLIQTLADGPTFKKQAEELKQHLAFELADIANEEKSDEELIADLERITYQSEEAITPLEKSQRLLQKLFDLLSNQLYTLASLSEKEPDLPRMHLLRHLKETSSAEQELILRIEQFEQEEGKKIHELLK